MNANPPVIPDNTSALLDRDAQGGQQSKWYQTGAPLFAHFLRFEIDAVQGSVNLRFSDDGSVGPAPRFGDVSAPLWFKLQGARLDHVGGVESASETPWRDNATDLTSAGVDTFRFVLLRNDPTIQVRRVRVFVLE